MNLFSPPPSQSQSLALKYRPQSLQTFCGQSHLIGENGILTKIIDQGQFINAIFRGAPGTGKTSLAQIIAQELKYHYHYLNATKASVADIKSLASQAQQRKNFDGSQTLLFLDEIHRFNKLQQDALLEDLENGNLLLIWATTENPYYQLNNALLSRCLAFEFHPLETDDLELLLTRIVQAENFSIKKENLTYIAQSAVWDARSAVNKLELISKLNADLSLEELKKLLPTIKSYHQTEDKYNRISAMIKSIRGSDPDAAVYRLASMLDGGEDPEYIARRLLISAGEDIGLANPQALAIASAGITAAKELGMPEVRIPLAEIAIYLALSPKSNSAYNAVNLAIETFKHQAPQGVPFHLTKLGAKDYKYPHDYPQHRVDQNYLETKQKFYHPCENKFETATQERLKKIRNGK